MHLNYLKSILRYDQDTGLWFWIVNKGTRARIGNVAGKLDVNGYIVIGIDSSKYYAHILAWFYMTGEWPKNEIDHKNTIRDNNEWTNLREATTRQNQHNRNPQANSLLGVKGVTFREGKYEARLMHDGKYLYLGRYDTLEKAEAAYRNKAIEIHKEFKHHLT
jgi:hypothetical protein